MDHEQLAARARARRWARLMLALWLLAMAIRIGLRAATGTPGYWEDGYTHYIDIAVRLGDGLGYTGDDGTPTAFRVPFYPLFVWAATGGGQRAAWALITAQAAVSAGTAVLAALLARRLAGPTAGVLAGLLCALWPYGAWHDVSLQESGLTAFLGLLGAWATLRAGAPRPSARHAALAGLVLGLGVLTRAPLLSYAVGAIVWLALFPSSAVHGQSGSKIQAWRAAAVAGLVLVATLSPWLVRQERLTGTIGLGTEGGASLYAGNHPLTFSAFPQGSIDESRARIFGAQSPAEIAAVARLGEGERDRWYRERALAEIAARPLRYAWGGLRKIWIAFGPWPVPRHSPQADLAYMAGWVPFLAAGIAGLALRRRHWRADFPLWWHFAAFAATTAAFWAQTAHRSALDPLVAVYAGVALAWAWERRARPFRSKAS